MAGFRPRTEHYTKLTPYTPGSRHAGEYEVYRQEIARFIAEGREGQFVMIDGQTVLGFWPTFQEAIAEASRRGLADPFVLQILTEQPILRSGYSKLCLN